MTDIVTITTTFTCFNTKWKNTGSCPLTLTTCGLVLHSLLLIELQLNEFTLAKLEKIVNPTKNANILLHYIIFFIKYLWMWRISSTPAAS